MSNKVIITEEELLQLFDNQIQRDIMRTVLQRIAEAIVSQPVIHGVQLFT